MKAARKARKQHSSSSVGVFVADGECDAVEKIEKILRKQAVAFARMGATELARAAKAGELNAAIIAEDLLSPADTDLLTRALDAQPRWADLPIVLIVDRDAVADSAIVSHSGQLRIVERPLHPAILETSLRSALRSSWYQHQGREFRERAMAAEEHYKELTETLEANVAAQIADLKAISERLAAEIEERKHAEELLRESEEMYRYTVELSHAIVWTADPDGSNTVVSKNFYALTGAPEGMPAEEELANLASADDYARVMGSWRKSIDTGKPLFETARMRVADGGYRDFEVRATPRRDEEGRILRWYGFVEDVTERKLAEERLRESEEMYRRTVELSKQIAWTSDAEGNRTVVTRRFYELTGTPEDIPFPLLLPQLIHPDDYVSSMERWRQAMVSGRLPVSEIRLRVADGSYRTFEARAVPRKDESGKIVRWYGFIEDITDRKQALIALEQAEERYRLAARATNDAIWDWNIATGRIAWSDAAVAYFGRGPIEDSDVSLWEEAIHPDDRERVLRSIYGAVEGDKTRWSSAYRLRKADGDYAYVYDRGFIIRDGDGKAVRAVGAVVDLTERRRAESELRRTQAELIHVSRVSAMGTMASTLAHELNQPLTAVTSYVRGSRRLLADSSDPAIRQVCEALEFAEAGALRAGQIVRRLRELVSRGAVAVGPEDLTRLIEDASVLAFVDEHLHGISHRIQIDPDARWVEADRIQIQQVLINLIRNAVQALLQEEKREVVIRARVSGEDMVEISVSDTGAGIPVSVRDALFSPFHSTKDEGMGIGLSISRTIVEAHHGRIWAEDNTEGGTVFRFTLPRVDVPPEELEGDDEPNAAKLRAV